MKKLYQLSIPNPCHENWQSMTANEKGRFCNACATTVVDFTGMPAAAVKDYLIQHKEEKICGRFDPQTLDSINLSISMEVVQKKYSFRRSFLLALLITMGTTLVNCTNTKGQQQKIESVEIVNADLQEKETIEIDTNKRSQVDFNKIKDKKACKDTTATHIEEPPPPHLATISQPERVRLIGEPALRITTGIPAIQPDVATNGSSAHNVPHISESRFMAMLHLVGEGKADVQSFKSYLCDELDLPVSVNEKVITFIDFCANIQGKAIQINELEISRDAEHCIHDIRIKYTRL
ncbi:hypothetical protein GCM10022393_34320 [Aquimarina addita]|uniref:Uncharacterized protein n=1 Tax=Aquimarina addita TaxID=870485 RepID=A0ABP6UT35_9FLAO